MNSILYANNDRIKIIQKHMARYRFKVSLEKLGVNKYFQFNSTFRDLIKNERVLKHETMVENGKVRGRMSLNMTAER